MPLALTAERKEENENLIFTALIYVENCFLIKCSNKPHQRRVIVFTDERAKKYNYQRFPQNNKKNLVICLRELNY